MTQPFSSGIRAYWDWFTSRASTLLERTCCRNLTFSGPSMSRRPMWLTSKIPQSLRQYRCSATMPVGYWMGISHPPKSTRVAPAATWAS